MMDVKRVSSFQSRSILVPQKTNIEFDIKGSDIIPNDIKLKDKTKNSLKTIIQRHQKDGSLKLVPKIIQFDNDSNINPSSISIQHQIYSDAIIEAFLENSSNKDIPYDSSESKIFHNRIHEEMNRIHQRAQINNLLTDEQRQQLVHLALTMDVPKLARRIVKENMELFLESQVCGSFLTDSLVLEDISSPVSINIKAESNHMNTSNMNKPVNNHRMSISNDSDDADAQFGKAFDEVDRIRKRIIQKASNKSQIINNTIEVTVAHTNNPSSTMISPSIPDSSLESGVILSMSDSNSNGSLQYLETNKIDASCYTGTFHPEDYISILNSTKSSTTIDGNVQNNSHSQSTSLNHTKIHNNMSSIVEQSTNCIDMPLSSRSLLLTTPRSKRNEIALSLDSLIGSRSNSMQAMSDKKQQFGTDSLNYLQYQLDCAHVDITSPNKGGESKFRDNNPGDNSYYDTPESIGNMLFHSDELLSGNEWTRSLLYEQSIISPKQHPVIIQDDYISTNANTIPVKSMSTSDLVSKSKRVSHEPEFNFIDDSLTKLITTKNEKQYAATGTINDGVYCNIPQKQSSFRHSHINQENMNISKKYTKPPLRSSMERDNHEHISPSKEHYSIAKQSIINTSIDNDTTNCINDYRITSLDCNSSMDSNIVASTSSKMHLSAKLLLASPMTSWLPSHINQYQQNQRSSDIERNPLNVSSSKPSIRSSTATPTLPSSSKLSKDDLQNYSFEDLPVLLPKVVYTTDSNIDQSIELLHQSSKVMKNISNKSNQSSIDNVHKSLQILNDHLSQFDQTSYVNTNSSSVIQHPNHRVNDETTLSFSNDKIAAISEYLPSVIYSKYHDDVIDNAVPPPLIKRGRSTSNTVVAASVGNGGGGGGIISRHNSNVSNSSDISSEDVLYRYNNDIDNTIPAPSINTTGLPTNERKDMLKKTFSNYSIDSLIDCSDQHLMNNVVYQSNNNNNIIENEDIRKGMMHEIDTIISNAKSRERKRSSSRSRSSRIRNCIQESMDINEVTIANSTRNGNNASNSTSNNHKANIDNNNNDISISSKASQRREALAAALNAGDAVGKLMAEMMIASNR